jgi:hypothetical protein
MEFERLLKERLYLKNVSPKALVYYTCAFGAGDAANHAWASSGMVFMAAHP